MTIRMMPSRNRMAFIVRLLAERPQGGPGVTHGMETARLPHHVSGLQEPCPVPDLRQNAERHRYEYETEAGPALAFYRQSDGVMTFTHTEVPAALRGRGIGSAMMRAVLTDVRAQGQKVIAA